jgi:hypothetical protein
MDESLDMERLAAMNTGWLEQLAAWPDMESEDAYSLGFEAGERFAAQRLPQDPVDLMPYAGLTKAEFEQTQEVES